MNNGTKEVSLEWYDEALHAMHILDALYSVGVDDWEGYDIAMELIGSNGHDISEHDEGEPKY